MAQGQVAIVTGASKGIGRYIAHSLAGEGAKLAVVALDTERLRKVSDELSHRGTDVLALRADVRREDDVGKMVDRVVSHFGHIDVLFNNAAVVTHFAMGFPRWPHIRDMDKGFWDRVIETNLGGTYLCTKHVLPHMEARRSGHIVNLYGGGNVKSIGACAYAVSKDAVRTFTRFVAEEEREWNICVIAMTPGTAVATEDAPLEAHRRLPGPEVMGNSFVLAARAGIELTGELVTLKNGVFEVVA